MNLQFFLTLCCTFIVTRWEGNPKYRKRQTGSDRQTSQLRCFCVSEWRMKDRGGAVQRWGRVLSAGSILYWDKEDRSGCQSSSYICLRLCGDDGFIFMACLSALDIYRMTRQQLRRAAAEDDGTGNELCIVCRIIAVVCIWLPVRVCRRALNVLGWRRCWCGPCRLRLRSVAVAVAVRSWNY